MSDKEYEEYYKEIKDRDLAIEENYRDLVFGGIKTLVQENIEAFRYCWKYGDGEGGAILEAIEKELGLDALTNAKESIYRKKTISRTLSKAVFERDLYRCKHCGTHKDLSVDHIYPESKGGDLDMDNLQTLCRSCNSKKGVSCGE
jgi:hypothetical protein